MARGDRSDALQKQFQKSVRKARSRGIDSRPRDINQQIKDQTKGIKTILQGDGDSFDGGRSRYIAAQSGINNLTNLLKEQQEKTLRDSIKSSFGKGNVRKSDFLGHKGDKMFLGMDFGSTPTIAASTINPFSGKTIQTIKAREGLTGNQYRDFINDLYDLDADLAYENFVPAPAKFLNKAMEVAAPFPLKILSGAMEGGKDVFDFFSDKGSRVGTDISDQLKRYYEGIRGLNPFEKTPVVEDEQGIKSIFVDESSPETYPLNDMAVDQAPLSNFFKIPMYTENYPEQQAGPNPLYVDPRNMGEFLNPNKRFNEGGIASLNDPRYTMRSNASNFSV